MKIKNLDLSQITIQATEISDCTQKIDLAKIYHWGYPYLNTLALFSTHFNTVPFKIEIQQINCQKAVDWFIQNFASKITNYYYLKKYSKIVEYDEIIFCLYEDVFIHVEPNAELVTILYKKTDQLTVEEIIEGIRLCKKVKMKFRPEVLLLVYGKDGIGLKSLEITKPKISIEDNYNDDFKDIHKCILERLSRNNDKGILLLHGKPGTGKTSYIRYLITMLKKEVIFVPTNMASNMTNPDLFRLLIENPNSIFVIEDAENIILDRNQDGNSSVSTLLNLSDGLLSDCLNIQIICSFNTDISKIDNALLRKGRLIARYEFKELELHKAQHLSFKLGFDTTIDSSMTLAAIYNQEEKDYPKPSTKNTIGFNKHFVK